MSESFKNKIARRGFTPVPESPAFWFDCAHHPEFTEGQGGDEWWLFGAFDRAFTRRSGLWPAKAEYQPKKSRKPRPLGFTLPEILVYVAILFVVLTTTISFIMWVIQASGKTKSMREVTSNAQRAIDVMAYEIKEATSVYTPVPVSSFGSHPGQLSLETIKSLPAGETYSYVDFYLCGTQLCMKKESQNPIAITSDRVQVNSLVFNHIVTAPGISSVQINLQISYINPASRPELASSINVNYTAALRSYKK